MNVRRVVTCHNANGKSDFQSDGLPPRGKAFVHTPGMAQYLLWATEPGVSVPIAGTDPTPTVKSFHPDPGATRFVVLTVPPDSVMANPVDPAAAFQEYKEETPGIVDRFEPDGMHQTETVDYGIILEGELWLELDEGKTLHLKQHDCVVQNGTRHGWRNKSDKPATIAFVLVGAAKRS